MAVGHLVPGALHPPTSELLGEYQNRLVLGRWEGTVEPLPWANGPGERESTDGRT